MKTIESHVRRWPLWLLCTDPFGDFIRMGDEKCQGCVRRDVICAQAQGVPAGNMIIRDDGLFLSWKRD
jgi:hypothetical protein